MSIERIIVTATVDTGEADVFGLEGLEPRTVARAFRLLLQEMATPGTTVLRSTAATVADGPMALVRVAGTLDRAERSSRGAADPDGAAAMVVADELPRPQPQDPAPSTRSPR